VRVREHTRKEIKIKAHDRKMDLPWGNIPARPFMMVADEDWTEILKSLKDFFNEQN